METPTQIIGIWRFRRRFGSLAKAGGQLEFSMAIKLHCGAAFIAKP